MILCAPQTLFNEVSVVKSEPGELVKGSNPSLVYSAHTAAGGVWRAPTRLLLKINLPTCAWKTETETIDRLPTGKKMSFERI